MSEEGLPRNIHLDKTKDTTHINFTPTPNRQNIMASDSFPRGFGRNDISNDGPFEKNLNMIKSPSME